MQLTRNVTHLEGESAKGKGGKGKGKDKRGEKGKGKQPVVWCGDSSNPKCWRQLVLPNATTGLLPREMEVSHPHLYLYLSSLVPSYTPSYLPFGTTLLVTCPDLTLLLILRINTACHRRYKART